MIKTVLYRIVVVLAAGLFSACGGGSWVDVPIFKCEVVKDFKTNEMMQRMAHNGCSNLGKAFAGDVRCEKDVVQVKCN